MSQQIDQNCPTCNNVLNKDSIKYDALLQRIIYKLIPNLLQTELERRERFILTWYHTNARLSEELLNNQSTITVKLVLKYGENLLNSDKENSPNSDKNKAVTNVKYIQCIAQTPLKILAKLMRNKFNIPLGYRVRMKHNGIMLHENENFVQVLTSFISNKV